MAPPVPHPNYFTFEQAAFLAGISYERLLRWKRDGLYVPELADHGLCTFRDIVALRTLRCLREEHGIPIQGRRGLREFGEFLQREREHPWSEFRFYVAGREVLVRDAGTGKLLSNYPQGQVTGGGELFDIEEVVAATRREVERQTRRDPDSRGHVGRRRGVAGGKSVVQGTRIRTATIHAYHREGFSVAEILERFPSLTVDDVKAAIRHEERRRASA